MKSKYNTNTNDPECYDDAELNDAPQEVVGWI